MVESITVKLGRHLHARSHKHHQDEGVCSQFCKDLYMLLADSAILYLKEHDHMKQTLGDQLRQRKLDDKLAAQMEGGE